MAIAAACFVVAMIMALRRPANFVYRGKHISVWSVQAYCGDQQARNEAEATFRALGDKAVPALASLLKTRDSLFRKGTWELAPKLPAEARGPILSRVPAPDAATIRIAAAHCLGILGTDASNAVPALANALSDSDTQVRFLAAKALGHIGKYAVSSLVQRLSDKDPSVRQSAAYGLGVAGPEADAATEELIHTLEDRDPQVRTSAAYALSEIGHTALPRLIEVIDHGSGRTRQGAARAVGWLRPSKRLVVGPLLKMLDDADPGCRQQAIETLLALYAKDDAVIAAMTRSLADPDEQVRSTAAKALNLLGEGQKGQSTK